MSLTESASRSPSDPQSKFTSVALPLLPALITATVKKSAIDAFREGRIDSATFRQRIAFSETH